MDESKIPLYRHVVREIEKENLFESYLFAPSINLVMKGSPKKIEVDCSEPMEINGWSALTDLFEKVNSWRDIDTVNVGDVIDGFEGDELRGIYTYRHTVSKVKNNDEKNRLLRLMLDRPSMKERLVYSARSVMARDDIFQVRRYLSSTLNQINESWGKDMSINGMTHKDAARLRLIRIGEYRIF